MNPRNPKYRQDGIHTMDDLIGRCRRNDETGRLVWAGPVRNGSGAVWVPALSQAASVTAAFGLLKGIALKPGQRWYATCGNVLCIAHRAIGTNGDGMRAARPKLSLIHRAKISAARRKALGKYSPELVADIRDSKETAAQVAERTGLHESTVSKVRLGQMWTESTVANSVFSWRPAA